EPGHRGDHRQVAVESRSSPLCRVGGRVPGRRVPGRIYAPAAYAPRQSARRQRWPGAPPPFSVATAEGRTCAAGCYEGVTAVRLSMLFRSSSALLERVAARHVHLPGPGAVLAFAALGFACGGDEAQLIGDDP